jgi:hypothetical protein
MQLFSAQALTLIARLSTGLRRGLYAALGGRLESVVRRHFIARNGEGNAKGWPSRQFWVKEGANKTALSEVTDHSATVSIASPAIAHKLEGGTISAKRKKYLAIPATPRAYALGSPGEGRWGAGELFLVRPKGKNPFLATKQGAGIEPQYWLVKSVTQAADPRTLPAEATLAAELRDEAEAFVNSKLEGAA